MPENSRKNLFLLLGALCFSAVLLFAGLGGGGIPAAQEGRTAIIVKNMMDSGNYMDMNVKDGIPYEKPIGHYWLCLPFAAVFHAQDVDLNTCASEWAFRLPSALSALAAIAAAMLLAFRIYGARTAVLTCVVLSSMVTFLHLGRLAHIDMPLCAAYAWAMAFLYLGYFERMEANRLIYGFYAFLGWGMLLKGPLVVILAGLTILAMMIRTRRWKMLWEIRPLTGGAVFLLISLPWYVAETVRTDGAFFEEFIMKQNLSRFTGIHSTYRNGERMSLFYYIPKLIAGAAPWSVFSLCALAALIRRGIRERAFPKISAGSEFLLFWFLTGFVFFSLSALKRGDYLLPVYPALGILTAAAVLRGCEKLPPLTKLWRILPPLTVLLFAGAVILSRSGLLIRLARARLNDEIKFFGRGDANNLLLLSSWANEHTLLLTCAFLVLLALLILGGLLMEKRKYYAALLLLCGVNFAAFGVSNAWLDPASGDKYRSVKPFTVQARSVIPENEKVLIINDFNTELLYFLNRPYEKWECRTAYPARFAVSSDTFAEKFLKEHSGEWEEVCRTGQNHQYPAVLLRRIREIASGYPD